MKKSEIVVGKTYARMGSRGNEIRRTVIAEGDQRAVGAPVWSYITHDQDWVRYQSHGKWHICTRASMAAWAEYEVPACG